MCEDSPYTRALRRADPAPEDTWGCDVMPTEILCGLGPGCGEGRTKIGAEEFPAGDKYVAHIKNVKWKVLGGSQNL